ncbi:hypothetical protein JMJ77_0001804, partial [Colletotrichum scovillei]
MDRAGTATLLDIKVSVGEQEPRRFAGVQSEIQRKKSRENEFAGQQMESQEDDDWDCIHRCLRFGLLRQSSG